jgi:hypothetical protein
MKEVIRILRESKSQINWFGMGEAIRLVQEIEELDSKDETYVADLGRRTSEFLQFRNVPNAFRLATELKVALEQRKPRHAESKS